jgi:hypothetical protein
MRYIKVNIFIPLDNKDNAPTYNDFVGAKRKIKEFNTLGHFTKFTENPSFEIVVNPSEEHEPY